MKKITVLGMLLTLCMILGACSGNPESTEATEHTSAVESIEPTAQNTSDVKQYSSMEEYVDAVLIDADRDAFTTSYMTYEIYADGDSMVYDYTYITQYENVDEIKESIDNSYNPDDETIQTLLSDLQLHVAVDNPKIKYIFRNNDGSIITEQIYE